MAKRSFDIIFSAIIIILFSPLLLLIALFVWAGDRGPVFYVGRRVGAGGVIFGMLKFRTMVVDAERLGASSTAADDGRLTLVGRVLRRFKLDELPQMINVLKGEMSVVGPRPQVKWVVDMYGAREKRLLDVRPGITDYASIKFRNEGEILKGSKDPDGDYLRKIAPEKIRLGLKYVDDHSLLTDISIIFSTLKTLVFNTKDGANLNDEKNHA